MHILKRAFVMLGLFSMAITPQAFAQQSNDWKVDFDLQSRVMSASGTTLGKDESSGMPTLMHIRFRPTLTASKGGFSATLGTGSDIYFGEALASFTSFAPASVNGDFLLIRQMNLKYQAENGLYAQAGVSVLSIPMYYGDPIAAVNIGWKNDNYDIKAFYAQLHTGNVVSTDDDGGLMGIVADLNFMEGLNITPFVVGVYQRNNVNNSYFQDPTSYAGYAGGAMFVGGFGVLPGVSVSYNSSFGLFVDAMVLGAFGSNNAYGTTGEGEEATSSRVKQTRKALGAYVEAGYSLESLFKASLFFDFRSGDTDATAAGTNSSFNGAMLEYDAHTAPLIILYNDGSGGNVSAYGNNTPDGYAYSDRGAITFGGTLNVNISDFSIGANLGYGMYAAGSDKAMGFELDVVGGYALTDGLQAVVQFGFLIPGAGLKSLVTGPTRMPMQLNVGLTYS